MTDQEVAYEIVQQLALGREAPFGYNHVDPDTGAVEAHMTFTPEQRDLLRRLLAERDPDLD